ncbi:unnamed protein product [Staurois parvus]|uniref:Uncharacterized protein n=1 Tax=Staurois parvus TaxID=386267 RepID=A0ABN9D6H7_9NEOB|nr:unnamed protein product [Staurois parvus]
MQNTSKKLQKKHTKNTVQKQKTRCTRGGLTIWKLWHCPRARGQ